MSIWKALFGEDENVPAPPGWEGRLEDGAIKSGVVSDGYPGKAEQIKRDTESAGRYWKEVRQHMRDLGQDPDLQ